MFWTETGMLAKAPTTNRMNNRIPVFTRRALFILVPRVIIVFKFTPTRPSPNSPPVRCFETPAGPASEDSVRGYTLPETLRKNCSWIAPAPSAQKLFPQPGLQAHWPAFLLELCGWISAQRAQRSQNPFRAQSEGPRNSRLPEKSRDGRFGAHPARRQATGL